MRDTFTYFCIFLTIVLQCDRHFVFAYLDMITGMRTGSRFLTQVG